ncbi:GNAT family N-acetyltransferase [Croceitalea rosinachiae]|uniref:GNAT family N-acetyltransferase n=1 Tax=Croceitalea rosinachiae TaxID=3075596 RepID=A0ABU3A6S3_9FLAO|nr:N-acetyltransferase family protein [Croceitalea sp. F388]MDT0605871.1 GNAT family N-acetyltransferase [Croceitalea sp. F388]
MVLRQMISDDWPLVSKIYAEGIATGYATFESTVPDFKSWDLAHVNACRIIAESNGTILGWAALSPVSSRCVYGGVAEVSVYIANISRGKGVGKALMLRLIEESEAAGYWTLQSGIFPENEASIKLHKKVGFRYLGKRERVGKTQNGIWKDNLLFEKRSEKVGL